MPEVTFYLLTTQTSRERHFFACKLIEKAYRAGVLPYVLTDSPEQSQFIDDLLWTFRAGSFIPHQIDTGEQQGFGNVILIGTNPFTDFVHTVVNLSSQCPPGFMQKERILEILDDNETTKALGRQRYRQYQQGGIKPTTHSIASDAQ